MAALPPSGAGAGSVRSRRLRARLRTRQRADLRGLATQRYSVEARLLSADGLAYGERVAALEPGRCLEPLEDLARLPSSGSASSARP